MPIFKGCTTQKVACSQATVSCCPARGNLLRGSTSKLVLSFSLAVKRASYLKIQVDKFSLKQILNVFTSSLGKSQCLVQGFWSPSQPNLVQPICYLWFPDYTSWSPLGSFGSGVISLLQRHLPQLCSSLELSKVLCLVVLFMCMESL